MPELNPTAIADYSQAKSQRKIMAIIGGMGPLASAAFLSSIYERSLRAEEQLSPRILLLSDPSFPDRTRAILDGRAEVLLTPGVILSARPMSTLSRKNRCPFSGYFALSITAFVSRI